MCGFPILHLHKYLKVLVEKHKRRVVMCEEFFREPLEGPKGGFDRRVVRIITPGTLIDEPFLNADVNNYLLSVGARGPLESTSQIIGLSWIDVSTGEFFAKECTIGNLRDELVRIAPREVVMDKVTADDSHLSAAFEVMDQEGIVLSLVTPRPVGQETSHRPSGDPEPPTTTLSQNESTAVKLLTTFLHDNLLESMPKLTQPSREFSEGRMEIDSHTVKGLEIRESMREGGTTGSLLSVIKRTATSSGTRLLARWLCRFSRGISSISFTDDADVRFPFHAA
jgi:DNA mismatch repair ATPase MutS